MKTKLSLYIHIPFCIRKCRYCDFLSGPADELTQNKYIDCLTTEIRSNASKYKEAEVVTVYFGGGTPSILPGRDITELLNTIRECMNVVPEAEITIELNPGTVDQAKLAAYKTAGINRLSIGLQSARDDELNLLGRIHSRKDFDEVYKWAREAGFDNISVDLMSAIPGQNLEAYKENLDYVISIKPEHISSYSFQLEEGTWFYDHKDEYEWPSEELDRAIYELTGDVLEASGYNRYEISNYALNGYESRHNSVYWTRGNYLGLGLGATSLIDNVRYRNTDNMSDYLSGTSVVEREALDRQAQMEEFMFLGLRLMGGINPEEFRREFGVDIYETYGDTIHRLTNEGLLICDSNIHLSKRGIDISNYVLAQFLMD